MPKNLFSKKNLVKNNCAIKEMGVTTRKRAQDALGEKFNIKDFHSALLDHGSPPLFIVEEKVKDMINNAKLLN